MGRLQDVGPSKVPLALLEDRTAEGSGGLFEGIDTSLAGMPWRDAPGTDGPAARRRFAARADSARTALGTGAFNRVVALLDRGKRDLSPQSDDSRAQILFSTPEQADQRRHTERALAIAAGLVADALAHDDRVIGGQIGQRRRAGVERRHRLDVRDGWPGAFRRVARGVGFQRGDLARPRRGAPLGGDADAGQRQPSPRHPTSSAIRGRARCTTGPAWPRAISASRSAAPFRWRASDGWDRAGRPPARSATGSTTRPWARSAGR